MAGAIGASEGSALAEDDHFVECLEMLFLALTDFHLNADGVAWSEMGEVGPGEPGGKVTVVSHGTPPRL